MIYDNKVVLHIPHCKWDGELKDIDYKRFEESLYSKIDEIGVGFYTDIVSGHYKGRRYPETLVTIFADSKTAVYITGLFADEFYGLNNVMQQESFAYELDGKLYVESLGRL